ncbi:MAG: T9SS type A sorting domain-containing protein [Bacteroidetes bacterium]|nr:T9SS type A sorting domain-containing protein [Bacteroidota bacterium]
MAEKVFQESQNSNSKKQNILINVSSGMYLINVISAGVKIETQKIIIE